MSKYFQDGAHKGRTWLFGISPTKELLLVFYCCITKYPQIWLFNTTNIYDLTVAEGQESGHYLAGLSGLESLKSQQRLHFIWRFGGGWKSCFWDGALAWLLAGGPGSSLPRSLHGLPSILMMWPSIFLRVNDPREEARRTLCCLLWSHPQSCKPSLLYFPH